MQELMRLLRNVVRFHHLFPVLASAVDTKSLDSLRVEVSLLSLGERKGTLSLVRLPIPGMHKFGLPILCGVLGFFCCSLTVRCAFATFLRILALI